MLRLFQSYSNTLFVEKEKLVWLWSEDKRKRGTWGIVRKGCWQPFSRQTAFTSFFCFQRYTFSFSPKRKFECEVLKVKITDSTFEINNITFGIFLWLIKYCYFWCLMKTGIAVGICYWKKNIKAQLPCKAQSRQF